jgi:hypothetical protein
MFEFGIGRSVPALCPPVGQTFPVTDQRGSNGTVSQTTARDCLNWCDGDCDQCGKVDANQHCQFFRSRQAA